MSIGEWKMQLPISNWFISSRNTGQFCIRHSNSENIEIMSGNHIDNAVNGLLLNLRENYSKDFTRMNGSKYHFERVMLL